MTQRSTETPLFSKHEKRTSHCYHQVKCLSTKEIIITKHSLVEVHKNPTNKWCCSHSCKKQKLERKNVKTNYSLCFGFSTSGSSDCRSVFITIAYINQKSLLLVVPMQSNNNIFTLKNYYDPSRQVLQSLLAKYIIILSASIGMDGMKWKRKTSSASS